MAAPSGQLANNLGSLFNIGKALAPSLQNIYNLSQDQSATDAAGLTGQGQALSTTNQNSGTGGTFNQASAADSAYLDRQQSYLQNLLKQADITQNQGLYGIGESYDRSKDRANTQQSRALSSYAQQQQDAERRQNQGYGQVNAGARTGLESLLRIIGMKSGTGSSAYQLAAPNAVARDASAKRRGVTETAGENFRNIDTARTNTNLDFENILSDLLQQRRDKERELKSGIQGQRDSINQSLAELAAQRAELGGADYRGILAAQDPYLNKINQGQTYLNQLFEQYKQPNISARDVAVTTPNLADFAVDPATISSNTSGGGEYSPYAQFIARQREERAV